MLHFFFSSSSCPFHVMTKTTLHNLPFALLVLHSLLLPSLLLFLNSTFLCPFPDWFKSPWVRRFNFGKKTLLQFHSTRTGIPFHRKSTFGNQRKGFVAHFLCLTFRFRQAFPEHGEDQAPWDSIERLAFVMPTAVWSLCPLVHSVVPFSSWHLTFSHFFESLEHSLDSTRTQDDTLLPHTSMQQSLVCDASPPLFFSSCKQSLEFPVLRQPF